jgi:hypothetical protein
MLEWREVTYRMPSVCQQGVPSSVVMAWHLHKLVQFIWLMLGMSIR